MTFNGLQRLVAVDVDSRFLFSLSSNSDGGGNDNGSARDGLAVISAEELNAEERQPRLPWK